MTIAVAPLDLLESDSLPPDTLDQLARTFGDCRQAVWVHDNSGRCVYRNPPARRGAPSTGPDVVQDILDYRNRRVGLLRIRSC